MEQLRVVLEKLKKYHFWILCGLIVVLALGVWFLATTDRASAFSADKKKIDDKIRDTSGVGQNPSQPQPSDTFNQAVAIRIDGDMQGKSEKAIQEALIKSSSDSLAGNVNSAATRLFDDQREGNRLPRIFADANEQAAFEAQFKTVWNHRIEEIEKPPASANPKDYVLDPQFRDRYRERIKDIFPRLFDMIELRTTFDESGYPVGGSHRMGNLAAGGFVETGGKPGQSKGVVDWPDAEKIKDSFHDWNDTPSTLAVMITQEDLWVYEALLRVIHNTNDMDAKHEKYVSPGTQAKARIKAIEALEIGPAAAQSWAASENAVFVFAEGGGAATATAGAGGRSAMGPGPAGAGFMGRGAMGSGAASGASVLAGRYVNDTGKPVDDLSQDPNKEFRMMPIDMRLMIEQKDIPRLLVECANSSMRIDVRSVRILAEKPPPFDPGGSSSTATDASAPGSTPAPVMGRTGERGGRAFMPHNVMQPQPDNGAGQTGDSGIYSYAGECGNPLSPPVLVEIQGIIYIYNPPTTPGAAVSAAPTGVGGVPAMPAGPASPAPATGPAATPAPGARR